MSFSYDVRNELARRITEKECCQKAELSAVCMCNAELISMQKDSYLLSFTLENAAIARKTFKMFKRIYGLQCTVNVKTRRFFKKNRYYIVNVKIEAEDYRVLEELIFINKNAEVSRRIRWSLLGKACCKRAYLRGIFLSRGFINRPEGDYHLEIICNDSRMADDVRKLMENLDLPARIIDRKNNLVVYLKEGDKIVDFLRLVEANKALLDFENARILKSVRNSVNRQVNCETANLAKTVNASIRQVEVIQNYVKLKGWESLPRNIRQLAMLRVDYPDYSLKELGAILEPPLSKSGTAYRMRTLESFIEENIDDY